jgi:Flp pilus assembly protein TadD
MAVQTDSWKQRVDRLIQKKKPKEAMTLLRKVLRLNAMNPDAMGIYAYLLLTYAKNMQQAKEIAQNGLNIHPGNINCLHTLAWYYYLDKNYFLSLKTFEEIQSKTLSWFELQYHWGLAAWKAKDIQKARKHFSLARNLNADSLKLALSSGLFLESLGETEKALKTYNQALGHVTQGSPIHEFLLAKISELLPIYKKISQLSQSKPNPKSRLSSPDSKFREEPKKTRKILKVHAQPNSTTNPFLKPIGKDLMRVEDGPEKLESLDSQQHYQLAIKFLKAGLKRDALSELNTVINLRSNTSLVISANSYLRQAEALSTLLRKNRLERLFSQAENSFSNSQFAISVYLYRKIMLLEPDNPKARKNLAYLYLHFERPLSALRILKPLVNDFPKYQEAMILKGYALAKLRRFSQSSTVLRQALELKEGRKFSIEYTQDLLHQVDEYEKPFQPEKNTN